MQPRRIPPGFWPILNNTLRGLGLQQLNLFVTEMNARQAGVFGPFRFTNLPNERIIDAFMIRPLRELAGTHDVVSLLKRALCAIGREDLSANL